VELAKINNISPTEAMMSLVRTAMGRAAYMDMILERALKEHIDSGGDPLNPPDELKPWLKESRQERMLAARTAKAAVDAGVMEALGRRLEMEGGLVADAVTAAMDVLGLPLEDRMRALGAAQERLLAAE
jgi:hypothetical protein